MFLDVQVDIHLKNSFLSRHALDKILLTMQILHSMLSNNKSALEMSMCQNETLGLHSKFFA